MTPPCLARDIIRGLDLQDVRRVLEPSCGDGSFVEAFLDLYQTRREGDIGQPPPDQLTFVGVEVDSDLLAECKQRVASKDAGSKHELSFTLLHADFFQIFMDRCRLASSQGRQNPLLDKFDLIIGNPPFGGSFPPEVEDELDTA